jgi:hypothetical protein
LPGPSVVMDSGFLAALGPGMTELCKYRTAD